jgi:hypothetical protein
MKRYVVIMAAVLTVGLTVGGVAASTASARVCFLVSNFRNRQNAGNWAGFNSTTGQCTSEVVKLTGEWVLVKRLVRPTVGNLWCAEILLTAGREPEKETGTFEDEECRRENARPNVGDFIEVIVPATARSTSVLPLSGESFPVSITSSSTEATELQNAAGTLKGKEFSSSGEILKQTGGLYKAEFKNVEEPVSKTKCNTSGDGAGVVLMPQDNFFFVHDESQEKGAAILFQVGEFPMVCGTTTVKIKGSQVGLVTNPNKAGEDILTSFKLKLHCSATIGESEDTAYWTSLLSSKLTPVLLANFGVGFRKACELISGEPIVNIGKMVEMMNP